MMTMNRTLSNVRDKLKPRKAGNPKHSGVPHFFLITDETRMESPEDLIRQLPRGTGVIFRHYEIQNREDVAKRLRTICRQLGIGFFVGGDWRLAAKVDAHGLHAPASTAAAGLNAGARLWVQRRKKILTAAAHTAPELRRARAIQAHAAILSPVFPTRSHPGQPSLGTVRFAALSRAAKIAVIALGGITKRNIASIYPLGCVSVAGISILMEK